MPPISRAGTRLEPLRLWAGRRRRIRRETIKALGKTRKCQVFTEGRGTTNPAWLSGSSKKSIYRRNQRSYCAGTWGHAVGSMELLSPEEFNGVFQELRLLLRDLDGVDVYRVASTGSVLLPLKGDHCDLDPEGRWMMRRDRLLKDFL